MVKICINKTCMVKPCMVNTYKYGQNLYDQNLYDQNLYDQNLYDQNLYDQNLYGQNLYGQNLYGQNLYGQNLYGQNFYISLCGSICSNFPWLWPLSSFLFFHCQNQTHCCLTTLPLSYICLTIYHHIHIIYYISSFTSDFILPIYLWSMGYKSRYGKCVTPSLRTMIKK